MAFRGGPGRLVQPAPFLQRHQDGGLDPPASHDLRPLSQASVQQLTEPRLRILYRPSFRGRLGGVVAWIEGVANEDLHLSAATLGELQSGVEITRDQDPRKAEEIEGWIDDVAGSWSVLPLDGRTFREWGRLVHRRSDDLLVDALIAATAKVHGLVVATRNVRDFDDFDVETINPFGVTAAPEDQEESPRV